MKKTLIALTLLLALASVVQAVQHHVSTAMIQRQQGEPIRGDSPGP